MEKKPGLFVRKTGSCVFKNLCMAVEVSLAEIFCCVSATPNIIRGTICYANLYSLVTIPHPEIIPCNNQFPMIAETTGSLLIK